MEKLYLSIREAAEWSGLSERMIRDFVNSSDPPPHMKSGSKVLIQSDRFPAYLEQKQEVRL